MAALASGAKPSADFTTHNKLVVAHSYDHQLLIKSRRQHKQLPSDKVEINFSFSNSLFMKAKSLLSPGFTYSGEGRLSVVLFSILQVLAQALRTRTHVVGLIRPGRGSHLPIHSMPPQCSYEHRGHTYAARLSAAHYQKTKGLQLFRTGNSRFLLNHFSCAVLVLQCLRTGNNRFR